jgi:hypothetical protein
VNQMWILKNSKDLLSTYKQGPSPPAIALKHLTSPPSTNCAPFLADLSIYLSEADFIQGFLKKNEEKLVRSVNFTFCYTDDVLSLNNSKFGEFVDRIFPIELEIKDTNDTDRSQPP